MTATDAFIALVQGPENALPLDHAALLLSAHATPDMDVSAQLDRLDDLAARCPEPNLDALRWFLFEEMEFAGNLADYSDPRNSFLDQVLDRRLGIPISLSVLMMEVGRRIGVALQGVGMPGHFLVRPADHPDVFIDPFNKGRLLDAEQCSALVASLFEPAENVPSAAGGGLHAALFDAARPRAILARMLANLKRSYADRRDPAALLWVGRLRAAIPGVGSTELVEIAKMLLNLGRFGEAADALDELASGRGDDGQRIRAQALGLRARLN